jgi:RIO-like serine/threonine protein kinase
MKATEARKIAIENKNKYSNINNIYAEINQAIEYGWYYTFISKFNITITEKEILEKDGYFIDTTYSYGFCVRWYEDDKEYFLKIIENVKKYARFKVSDEVIVKYLDLQDF